MEKIPFLNFETIEKASELFEFNIIFMKISSYGQKNAIPNFQPLEKDPFCFYTRVTSGGNI